MGWINNMFKSAPATLDEGIAEFEHCPWSEEELVAWLNRQDKAFQVKVWGAIARDRAVGHSRETIVRSLSGLRKKIEASRPNIWWRLLNEYWEMRQAWWQVDLMQGNNKPIRVKVD